MGLIADTAKDLPDEVRAALTGINWRELSGMRTFLVHRPWDVNTQVVWQSATEDIPVLLTELRRVMTKQTP
jgi:uncharacterized protein with HEPN domain